VARTRIARRGIEIETRRGVARFVLDRAADANRFTYDMAAAFADACLEVEDGPAVAVEIRGRGRWFCGGVARGVDARLLRDRCDPVAALAGLTKPVIAVLSGAAVGVGAALALAADLRVAAAESVLEFGEAASGGFPGFGVTQRLPRLVGRVRALEILLLGGRIRARAAAVCGLVSRVAPRNGLERAARETTAAVCRGGPLAMALAKEAVTRAGDLPLADGMRMEEDLYALLLTTADRAEGVRSFLEKRTPKFRGR
jgi:enoyl-CoA hydratase